MDLASEKRFHRLLGQALDLPREQWNAWLQETCGDDSDLRQLLEHALAPDETELETFFSALAQESNVEPAGAQGIKASTGKAHAVEVPNSEVPNSEAPNSEAPNSEPAVEDTAHWPSLGATGAPRTSVMAAGRGADKESDTTTGGRKVSRTTGGARTSTPFPATSLGERLRQLPAAGGFIAAIGFALALVIAASIGATVLLRGVDPQFNFGSVSGRVASAFEAWPQLRSGDEIREVQGVQVQSDPVRIRAALLEVEPGPLTLRIRRGDEERAVTATVEPYSRGQKLVLWTRVLTGALLWLIGLTAVLLRPDRRAALCFLAFCASLGVHLLGYLALLQRPTEGLILENIGLLLATATGLHLFASYPQRLMRRKWIWAFYAPALVGTTIELAAYALPSLRSWLSPTIQFVNIYAALAALGSLALTVLQFLRARRQGNSVALARSRALLVALLIGLVIPSALNATTSITTTFHWALTSFPVIVFAGMTAYAIVRHNALEVDRFTSAVVGYGMTTLFLGALFGLLVVGVPAWLSSAGWLATPMSVAAVTAAAFFLFQPLYRRVRTRVDRWFQRAPMDKGQEVQLLRNLASSVRRADRDEIFADAVQSAQRLEVEHAEVWTRSPDQKSFVRSHSDDSETHDDDLLRINIDGPLAMALEETGGGLNGYADVPLEPEAQEELWQLGLVLAVPIRTGRRLEGFLAVGRKVKGGRLSTENRVFLEAIASQLAIAFERTWQHERMGPYRLRHRLGTGGMAEVLLADKLGPGGFEREVAIKRLLPHLAQESDSIDMFLDEARIAAQLRHPHIVQIYDIEQHEGQFFLAMEYMDGPSLASLLYRSGARRRRSPVLSPNPRAVRPLPFEVVAAIASALLGALHYAHDSADRKGRRLGLIHRDVKPANILTSRQGDLKLADFGIAKAEFRLYQTQGDKLRGTPAYMAPEQAARQPAVRQSDLFSAAAVLFEALALRRAFPKGASEAVLTNHPPKLQLAQPGYERLEARLAQIFERAFHVHPDQRHDSAEAMREDFLTTLGVTPASPEDVSAWIATLESSTSSVHRSRLPQVVHSPVLDTPEPAISGPAISGPAEESR